MNTKKDDSFDDLINELKNSTNIPQPKPKEEIDLKEDDLSNFIIKNSANIIQNGIETIEQLKDSITQTTDADTICAFSDLIKASANALEVINKIHMQNKKIKAQKEITQMEIDAKLRIGPSQNINNNILVTATRERLFELIRNEMNKEKIIDVTVTENQPPKQLT